MPPTPKIWKASEISIQNIVFEKKTKIVSTYYPSSTKVLEPLYLLTPKLEYNLPVQWERLRLTIYLMPDSINSVIDNNEPETIQKENINAIQQTNTPVAQSKLKGKQFGRLFKQLDEVIPNMAYKNRKLWFDESLWEAEPSVFQENYRRQVSYDKDKARDCVKFNLMDTADLIYNEANQLIDTIADPLQELAFSKHYISMLLKCRGIWIVEEAYGLSWDIMQIKMYQPKNVLPSGCRALDYTDIKNHQLAEIKMQEKPNLAGIDMASISMTSVSIPSVSIPLVDNASIFIPSESTVFDLDEPVINYLMKDE